MPSGIGETRFTATIGGTAPTPSRACGLGRRGFRCGLGLEEACHPTEVSPSEHPRRSFLRSWDGTVAPRGGVLLSESASKQAHSKRFASSAAPFAAAAAHGVQQFPATVRQNSWPSDAHGRSGSLPPSAETARRFTAFSAGAAETAWRTDCSAPSYLLQSGASTPFSVGSAGSPGRRLLHLST